MNSEDKITLAARIWRSVVCVAAGFLLIAGASSWMIAQQRAPESPRSATDLAELQRLRTQLAKISDDVQYMTDRQAILDCIKRYTRGADRHDEALMRSAFWPDARISYGNPMSREEFIPYLNYDAHGSRAATQHHVTGQLIEINGNTAHSSGYVIYSSQMPRDTDADTIGQGSPGHALVNLPTPFGSGRYLERYERRNGEWKILVREYVEDASVSMKTVDLCASACLGRWDPSDISYLRPLESVSSAERLRRAELGRKPSRALKTILRRNSP